MAFGNIAPMNPVGFLTPFGPRKINEIPLDVVIDERIEHVARITSHPIEVASGSGLKLGTIADNAYLEPIVYTMRGGVSDFPISWRLFRADALTRSYSNSYAETRSDAAYELLLRHFRGLVPFTLVGTPYGDLENMIFRRLSVPKDGRTHSAILFDAEIVELQVVVSESVTAGRDEEDVSGEAAETDAVSEVDRGSVAPVEIG